MIWKYLSPPLHLFVRHSEINRPGFYEVWLSASKVGDTGRWFFSCTKKLRRQRCYTYLFPKAKPFKIERCSLFKLYRNDGGKASSRVRGFCHISGWRILKIGSGAILPGYPLLIYQYHSQPALNPLASPTRICSPAQFGCSSSSAQSYILCHCSSRAYLAHRV